MGALFPRCIASFGVTLPTYRGMAVLREQKDQRLSDLAAEISTLSRFVGKMKHKGLVTRSRLEDKGRTVAINHASKDRPLVEGLTPIAVHFEEVALSSYSDDEVDDLKVVF